MINNISEILQAIGITKIRDYSEIKNFKFEPKTLNDIYKSIIEVGRIVNREYNAHQLVDNMKIEFERIKQYPVNRKKIYIEEWHRPPTAAGNWIPKLINIAGGRSLLKEGVESSEVTWKRILRFDPDIIILSWHGFENQKRMIELYSERGWHWDVPIHIIDYRLLQPSTRLVEGTKKLVKIIKDN